MTEVVVESEPDAVALRSILRPRVPPGTFRVTAAGGFSPAMSLARTFCLDPNVPVALVLNSGSTDAAVVRRRRELVASNLIDFSESGRLSIVIAEPSTHSWLLAVLGRPATVAPAPVGQLVKFISSQTAPRPSDD
jgi:hypothetical protein